MNEPLSPKECRARLRSIISGGETRFSRHAEQEMAKDGIAKIDVINVLRGGVPQPGENENGSWRYQVRTQKFVVVVAFRSEDIVVVVTAWRLKK